MGYSVRKNSPREWRVKGKGSEAGNVEEQTQGRVLAFWLLLGIKHNWSLGLTGPFLEKLYAYQHLRIVCPWGEEGCICWMLYLISLVSGPPCSMLNPIPLSRSQGSHASFGQGKTEQQIRGPGHWWEERRSPVVPVLSWFLQILERNKWPRALVTATAEICFIIWVWYFGLHTAGEIPQRTIICTRHFVCHVSFFAYPPFIHKFWIPLKNQACQRKRLLLRREGPQLADARHFSCNHLHIGFYK